MSAVSQFDRTLFRKALGRFPTGVTVLTVCSPELHGMTVNSFTSVSLEPPLISVCVAGSSHMHDLILSADCFAVSMLGEEHAPVALHFASASRPFGPRQFDSQRWTRGPATGAPVLDGAVATFECQRAASHLAGDHTIVIGEVLRMARSTSAAALLFADGELGRPGPPRANYRLEGTEEA